MPWMHQYSELVCFSFPVSSDPAGELGNGRKILHPPGSVVLIDKMKSGQRVDWAFHMCGGGADKPRFGDWASVNVR